MATQFTEANKLFSDCAHKKADEVFYPKLFHGSVFTWDDNVQFDEGERGKVLDGQMAIDRIARVKLLDTTFRAPILLTIQERFRNLQYMDFGDITITEWNVATNQPSEFHKLTANIFVYGFYDQYNDKLVGALAIDVACLMLSIIHNNIHYSRMNNGSKNQDFISIKYRELYRNNCVLARFPYPITPQLPHLTRP